MTRGLHYISVGQHLSKMVNLWGVALMVYGGCVDGKQVGGIESRMETQVGMDKKQELYLSTLGLKETVPSTSSHT